MRSTPLALVALLGCSDYDLHPDAHRDGLQVAVTADPPLLDLGDVPMGSQADGVVTLINTGTSPVYLQAGHITQSGDGFSLLGPVSGVLQPGASHPVPIGLRAGTFAPEGVLEVPHTDDRGQVDSLVVPLRATGLAGSLLVDPPVLDLGPVPTGCDIELPLDLINVGTADLEVQEAAVVGAEHTTVAIDTSTPIAPDEARTGSIALTASTTPAELDATLWLHHDGIGGVASAAVKASIQPRARVEQTFLQDGPWPAVDLLVVVDSSGSMHDDIDRLVDGARDFFTRLSSRDLDVRVSGITRDDGCVNGAPVATEDIAAVETFARSLSGEWGHHTESLLTIATAAIEDPSGCNAGVRREDARTAVLLLSDEPDQSDDPWDDYVGRMRRVDPTIVLSGIVGPPPEGCETAFVGDGYLEAIEATGGATESICAPDWSAFLDLQAEVMAGTPRTRFELSADVGPGDVWVTVDGEEATDWWIDPEGPALVFDDHAQPPAGAVIRIDHPAAADCDSPER